MSNGLRGQQGIQHFDPTTGIPYNNNIPPDETLPGIGEILAPNMGSGFAGRMTSGVNPNATNPNPEQPKQEGGTSQFANIATAIGALGSLGGMIYNMTRGREPQQVRIGRTGGLFR